MNNYSPKIGKSKLYYNSKKISTNPSKIKNNNFIAVKANRDLGSVMKVYSPTTTTNAGNTSALRINSDLKLNKLKLKKDRLSFEITRNSLVLEEIQKRMQIISNL